VSATTRDRPCKKLKILGDQADECQDDLREEGIRDLPKKGQKTGPLEGREYEQAMESLKITV